MYRIYIIYQNVHIGYIDNINWWNNSQKHFVVANIVVPKYCPTKPMLIIKFHFLGAVDGIQPTRKFSFHA
jgi:hypothetical protein